jgi:hypothetical protein
VKNKVSLQLMEQLVMILVFALAAALCLQVFARAAEISEETARYDRAVTLAANAAELLKATEGDISAAEALGEEGFRVTVTRKPQRLPGLAEAEIQVFWEQQPLFRLDTGWQEELP